nr:hypothetical protein [Tanacetum cinerariifolium]
MPKIEKYVTESLGAEVLVRSTNQPQTTYVVVALLLEFELKKILIDKMKANKSINRSNTQKNLYNALVESYNFEKDIRHHMVMLSYLKEDEMIKTRIKTPLLVKTEGQREGNQVKMLNPPKFQSLRKKSLQAPPKILLNLNISLPEVTKAEWFKKPERPSTPDLDWSTCKSITKLEYHHKECSKATTERLDWHNHENKPYPFNIRKPLLLIQDHRGRQIIPKDHFINKDQEYLKGGDSSRQYSTSVMKTKDATYELKWIEDLVLELWSPVVVKYDKHAYFGTTHWGPKCQSFLWICK